MMRITTLVGLTLLGIAAVTGGYFLGQVLDTYLPNVSLFNKLLAVLAGLGVGSYLVIRYKGCLNCVSQDRYPQREK